MIYNSGMFKQGGMSFIYIKINDMFGNAIDPYNITVSINGPSEDGSNSTEVSQGTPSHIEQGMYVYMWEVPSDAILGSYTVVWNYFLNDEEINETHAITVVAYDADVPYFYSEKWIAFRAAFEHHIRCAQSVPVYFEQAKSSYDRKTFYFTFKNWNNSAGAKIYRNSKLVSSGVEIDFMNGKVVFDNTLMEQEQINADYNFQWFTDEDLNRFLLNSLQMLNSFTPHSNYDMDSLPEKYTTTVLYGAIKDALRQMMMCINFQQPAMVFGGSENAQKAFSNFETLKQNYSKDWEKLVEQKKLGPYPSGRIISTPEFTLPGGRSRWFRYMFKS